MSYKKTKLCATLLLCFGLFTGYAQQEVNASGGNASGSGGSSVYSLGQIFETNIISGCDITEIRNIQQPSEIITDKSNEAVSEYELSVYPNPTENNLNLLVKNSVPDNLKYQLFDMQGSLLKSNAITGNQTQIETSDLPPATYFLKIMQENTQVQSFKIVKF